MKTVWMLGICAMVALVVGCDDYGASNAGAKSTTAPGVSGKGSGAATKLEGKLTLTGSSTVGPLVSEIAKRFEAMHPDVRIDVQTGGSSRGIADAGTGLADIGMSSRGLKDSEKEGRVAYTIAVDGVGFIVHKNNPVTALTKQQAIDIYTGKVDNWSQVGGSDAAIVVINRAAGRSELELVTSYLGIKDADIAADLIAGENQQGLKMVANDPNAITYMSVGASEFEVQNGAPLKLLDMDGVTASAKTVADGTFPLARPLILITKPQPTALVKAFIEYAQSDAINDLVKEFAYVTVDR